MIRVSQTSGSTIHASHIEEPRQPFFVEFEASAFFNVLMFEAGKRWVRVLAQTADGALQVARYHFCLSGRNFHLIPNPQV